MHIMNTFIIVTSAETGETFRINISGISSYYDDKHGIREGTAIILKFSIPSTDGNIPYRILTVNESSEQIDQLIQEAESRETVKINIKRDGK